VSTGCLDVMLAVQRLTWLFHALPTMLDDRTGATSRTASYPQPHRLSMQVVEQPLVACK